MKSFFDRVVAITSAVLIVATMLSGCGKEKSTSANEITEVHVWSGERHSKSAFVKLVEEYNNTIGAKKGLKIVYEVKEGDVAKNIELALQSNQAPEIFQGGSLAKMAESGYIAAIDDLPGGSEIVEKYSPYIRDFYNRYNGKTYNLPFGSTINGIVYNKDMFKKAGIVDENGEAKPPKTWKEVREYAKILTNDENNEYGFIYELKDGNFFGGNIESPSVASKGHLAYDPVKGEYDYGTYREIMETVLGIKEDKSYMPGAESLDNDRARARFSEGNVGMKIAYSFDVGVYNDQFPAKCDWGVAPMPVIDENDTYKQYYDIGSGFFVNTNVLENENLDKIMEAYRWLNSDELFVELYKQCLYIPYNVDIVKDVKLENAKKGWEEFKDIMEISVLAPVNRKKDITGVPKPQDDFLNLVWPGEMSVDEFIEKHNKISNDGIKTYQEMYPEYDGESYIISDWNTRR